jgi:hypothetical protein
MVQKYVMTISRMTVDKLGVKLYDRVSAVIAELVANGYDADATEVVIEAPMGHMLASLSKGAVTDSGYRIEVRDDGCGMPPEVINSFYLKVGGERRKDPERGDRSKKFDRRVMGRKGVGKLAPFGICNSIEVITSGGEIVDGIDENGIPSRGYLTAHFTMKRDQILADQDTPYEPDLGRLDGTVQAKSGSRFIMTDFIRRQVPDLESFSRQLSQRFGMATANWKIILLDNSATDSSAQRMVGEFSIETMPNTKITLDGPSTEVTGLGERSKYTASSEDSAPVPGAEAGFVHTDGRFYPVTGWVAYAKEPYRDELMAGIRIYCRGKIAAQTAVFNRKSGFTGEYNVRSYLVGELHADWLDEAEDLIQTDRRDILWSDELGQAFEQWGQRLVELVGTREREPMKKKVWDEFLATGDVMNRVENAFPGERWKSVRDTTIRIAKLMGERLRPAEAKDTEHVDSLVQLSLMLGPHVQLDEALKDAASDDRAPIAVMATILRTARVAELSSYGMIAEKRVQVIERIIELKDDDASLEQALQNSIEEAPWLINPLWSPITANQSLTSLKNEFEKFFEAETGVEINLNNFDPDKNARRPDFVLSADDFGLQIIEIKKPKHKLKNDEWDRIQVYIDQMSKFLNLPGHEEFMRIYKGFTVTVVCDEIGLSGAHLRAFESYKDERTVEHITWTSFLRRTQHMHKEFLAEAERQRQLAVGSVQTSL